MPAQLKAAEVMRLPFLEMTAIGQQYAAQLLGGMIGINRPSKTLLVGV